MDYKYNNLIEKLSNTFHYEMNAISANYNFDYGDEFEIAICHMLRNFLPIKYGICRGFVVNSSGKKVGDDIIIYDQELFPTLRFLVKNDFSRKEEIPIEAVYAYIEAKHKLDSSTLSKSIKQVQEIKKLCYERAIIKDEFINNTEYFEQENNKILKYFHYGHNGTRPSTRNPIYTMIISRYCVDTNNNISEDKIKINEFLVDQFNNKISTLIKDGGFYNPDLIISGKANTIIPAIQNFEEGEEYLELLPFRTNHPMSIYQINPNDDISYGLGLSHMMQALNIINLKPDDMPWGNIFNYHKIPDESLRKKTEVFLNKNDTQN